jgi:hypothetical protein
MSDYVRRADSNEVAVSTDPLDGHKVSKPKRRASPRQIKDMTAKQKLALLKKIAPSMRRPRLKKQRINIVINTKGE